MAAILSCSPLYTTSKSSSLFNKPNKSIHYNISVSHSNNVSVRRFRPICSSQEPDRFHFTDKQKVRLSGIKECVISVALAAGLITGVPTLGFPSNANAIAPVLPDLAVLISGPPIKDPGALLRYALPIDNKAIREVQKPLEDITESLKNSGVKAIDSVERNLKQASRALKQGKSMIIAGVAESKKDHAIELLAKLEVGMDELQKIAEDKKREAVAPKQKELLQYVGGMISAKYNKNPRISFGVGTTRLLKIAFFSFIPLSLTAAEIFMGHFLSVEEDMVDGFPYEVPEEYQNMPLLKGRATVDMKVKVKDNPNLEECVFRIVLDGYNAPVTAGNFIDLVERKFYDGMEIQRADGFVVQTGDPEGPAEGFIDPSTEKTRTIPLEIMVEGEKAPIYGETLEDIGLYKAQTKLPFNAFGTMAMAREEFENNSASSQVFWLLKESELTPSNANILDGRYAVFGYVTENEDFLADLKVGDVIESVQVVAGLDNLVNPSYKIAG
ncbi:peptidyl-prolyl cis-trans isomerase protein [Artemisia annua]|uniref:peptidylprolyl isomerase n=1 Tax=Artemisia annua TaxID=35608 RepID=A0A2U1PVG3_ARTAN|nr:peptidyl-prolyl cis-trans isomerase protein [Artemisia annua]